MSRRHQKPQQKPSQPKLSQPAPRPDGARGLGLKAFHTGNYSEAIRLWNELGAEEEPPVRAAVAEAHFRRALATRLPASEALTDLRRTVDLLPGEARCWYQFGLMLHRNDRLEEARQAYARAADLGLARRGIGLVRGLAELEVAPDISLDTLPWLTLEARTALAPIADLLRGEPCDAPTLPAQDNSFRTPGGVDPVAALWQGLTLLARGEASDACAALSLPKGQRLPIGAEPTRAFYYGVAAAHAGKPQLALSVWRGMTQLAPLAAAARPPHLAACISQIAAHSLLALQEEGRWEEALDQAQSGMAFSPGDTWLLQAALIAANRLAAKAQEAGDWDGALSRWQFMHSTLKAHPGLGPLPPVLHNIALAYEAGEDWEAAAEGWVDLLNALPRRGGRTPRNPVSLPQAGSGLEEQRTWIRRRILDDYGRAELPDAAIAYYKQAVKADPENLELRLEMVTAYLANDQSIAARNEVQRVLDKDPKQIDALLLKAEIHQIRDEGEAAEQALTRILEIDPHHDTARKAIRQMILQRGVEAFNYGQYYQARALYTQLLVHTPNDPEVLVFLGQTELILGRKKQAWVHFEAALASGEPNAYGQLFLLWGRSRNEAEARKILQRAETTGVATSDFYIRMGSLCLTHLVPPGPPGSQRPALPPLWEKWGRELIDQGLDTAPDRSKALEYLISTLGPQHAGIAVGYVRQLAALKPDDPEYWLDLALYQGFARDVAGARATLTQAERLARKQGRKDLIDKIAELRREIGSPLFAMMGSLAGAGGLKGMKLEDFDDEDLY